MNGPLLATLRQAGHRGLLALTVLGGLLQHGGAIVAAATGGWLAGSAAAGRPASDLGTGIAVLGVAVAASVAGNWMNAQYSHAFAFRHQAALRLRMFDGLERSAPRELQGRRTGDAAAVAMGDVDQLELFFAHLAMNMVFALVLGVASVAALAAIDPMLALVGAVGLAAVAAVPAVPARRAAEDGQRLRDELGTLNADVVDGVQGLRELVVFRRVGSWQRRIAERTRAVKRHQLAHGRVAGLQEAATDGLVSATTLAVLVVAVSLAASGDVSLATATMAVTLTIAALRPAVEAVGVAGQLAPLRASARRVLEIVDQPAQVPDTAAGRRVAGLGPGIGRTDLPFGVRFEHVDFAYEPGRPVLRDVTFDVPAGQTVAVVGHSGAGKSTCVNLLLRFWDVDGGAVTLGGHDVRDIPLADLRRSMAVIPQDVYLFAGSVADNLRLGRPDASDAELEAAARAANAHEFVAALPAGYDTEVGERGALLSGGQRQRLAIARALLTDAPVLVMDEAASNLDTENEREIQDAIRTARHGRTTVIIAHRLSTIRAAERIVVLDHGRVAEVGAHDDLVAAGGTYAALVAAQHDGLVGTG
jgi:ATP-binding cassette, subfamily C, bacterial CydC